MGRETFPVQEKRLLWVNGSSAVLQGAEGAPARYLYIDGSTDSKSKVEPRTPHLSLSTDELDALRRQVEAEPGTTLKQKAGELAMQREAELHSPPLTESGEPAIITT